MSSSPRTERFTALVSFPAPPHCVCRMTSAFSIKNKRTGRNGHSIEMCWRSPESLTLIHALAQLTKTRRGHGVTAQSCAHAWIFGRFALVSKSKIIFVHTRAASNSREKICSADRRPAFAKNNSLPTSGQKFIKCRSGYKRKKTGGVMLAHCMDVPP